MLLIKVIMGIFMTFTALGKLELEVKKLRCFSKLLSEGRMILQ